MAEQPGLAALVAALGDWRRHAVAIAIVAVAFGFAVVAESTVAVYGAALVGFAVWMAWFVLTAIAWLDRADF